MSWNECLYQYHRRYGGQLLAGDGDEGLLVLTWKEQPLAVDLNQISGRYGFTSYARARLPVTLGRRYVLTIGEASAWSGGVNAVLKAVPGRRELPILPADFGFPEVTKKRLIRSDHHAFTKLVLGSLALRNALAACPKDRLEIRPGPGEEGLHLITVTDSVSLDAPGGSWPVDGGDAFYTGPERRAEFIRRVETEFFPRMEQFLALVQAARDAVTQWPVPEK